MKIKIKNNQRKIPINQKEIIHLIKNVLRLKGISKAQCGIWFVGKRRIRSLNRKFRKINRPTDVLAFSMREGKGGHLHPEILGDLVICPEMAQKYAKIYKTTTSHEIYLYLIHGILHLLGYADTTFQKHSLMQREQAKILKKIIAQ